MSYVLDTAPTTYPVTLEEAKIYLKLNDISEEDSLVTELIQTATEQVEAFTERRLITQTWRYLLDVFPPLDYRAKWPGAILLPFPPCQSVTWVKYYSTSGTFTTMTSGTDYVAEKDSQPCRVVPAPNIPWPSTQTDRTNAVEVKFVCGYGAAAAVPGSIKIAIKRILLSYFDNRGAYVDTRLNVMPEVSERLLWPYRDLRL